MKDDTKKVEITISGTMTISISKSELRKLLMPDGDAEEVRRPLGRPRNPIVEFSDNQLLDRVTVNLNEAMRVTGISRTGIYRLLSSGDLKAVHSGRRLLIKTESIREYMANLPDAEFRRPRT